MTPAESEEIRFADVVESLGGTDAILQHASRRLAEAQAEHAYEIELKRRLAEVKIAMDRCTPECVEASAATGVNDLRLLDVERLLADLFRDYPTP